MEEKPGTNNTDPQQPIQPPQTQEVHRKSHQPSPRFVYWLYRTPWARPALAILAGLLLVGSFPPINYGQLAWIALVPLLVAIFTSPSIKNAGLIGLITGAVFYSISLSFFLDTFGLLGLFLANILSLCLVLFAVSVWYVASRWDLSVGVFFSPIAWVGVEYFRSELIHFIKFSWLSLGYSQHNSLVLIQSCDLIGVYGLSFLILAVNTFITWFILEDIRRRKKPVWCLSVSAILFALLLIYGVKKVHRTKEQPEVSSPHAFNAVVVQEEKSPQALDRYIDRTRQNIGEARRTLVVWPEACVESILNDPARLNRVQELIRQKQSYFIIGTIEYTDEAVRRDNLAVLFSPDGEIIGKYAKRMPVPFVEAVIRPGNQIGVYETDLGKIGILICYEMGFTDMVRETVRHGANVLVIPTMEISGGKLEHLHHASMAPFRAVETRRFIIRPAGFGISMIVHPSGMIQSKLNFMATGTLSSLVKTKRSLTFYVRVGYLLPIISLVLYLLMMIISVAKLSAPRIIASIKSWFE